MFSLSTDCGPWAECLPCIDVQLQPRPALGLLLGQPPMSGSCDLPACVDSSVVHLGLMQSLRTELPLPMLYATLFCYFPPNWPRFQGRRLCNRFLISRKDLGEDVLFNYTCRVYRKVCTKSRTVTVIGHSHLCLFSPLSVPVMRADGKGESHILSMRGYLGGWEVIHDFLPPTLIK